MGHCLILTERMFKNLYLLQQSVCKTFEQGQCNVDEDKMENFKRLKGDPHTGKLSRKWSCNEVLSAKTDLENVNMTDLY